MNNVVDFHSHILFNVDDGSTSMDESIAMLRMEASQGIQHVIATPHFYPNHDSLERFLERRNHAEVLLREEMAKHAGMPKLSMGAEVYFFPGISASDILSELTIDKKKHILIEMPRAPWTDRMYQELENIRVKQDLIPIIAHVDRYITPFRTYGIPERLAEIPVIIQANASFFLHKSTARMALRLLRKNMIQLLGSDCHNLDTRAPNLGSAIALIEKRLGKDMLTHINFYENEVLCGV